MRSTAMIAIGIAAVHAQRWPQLAPGVPVNVTVTAGAHSATIRWAHAPLSAGGGLATSFAVLWQREGRATAELTEAIVVGTPEYVLTNLRSGRSYGFRISAFNPLGTTFSSRQRFTTLAAIRCASGRAFGGLELPDDPVCEDEEEEEADDDDENRMNPETEEMQDCEFFSKGSEYILAGISGGSTLAFES